MRTLDALRGQTVGPQAFEVIVVIDAGTDDTPDELDRQSWPFALRHAAAVGRGPSSARNTGAAMARGCRIVFLDDDIVADPGFLAAHLDAAQQAPGAAVVGQSAPAVTATGWFGKAITDWWTERFRTMAAPGYRFGHTDVMSGNLSVPRDLFAAIGGFDTTLLCREDYELGYRLAQDGVRIVYAPDARGLHHDASTPARNLSRARNEGIADAQIAVKHPALFPWLRSAAMTAPTRGAAALRILCFRAPAVGRAALGVAASLAPVLEALRLYRPWERVTALSRALSYQLGVAAQAGSFAALDAARQGSLAQRSPPRTADIDLLDGLAAARSIVGTTRPDALTLRVGKRVIARRHAEPGLERLGQRHIDANLADEVWHWAIHVEAAQLVSSTPKDAPDWAARSVDQSSGHSIRLAELDVADWTLTDRSDDMGFPLKVLVRAGRLPLGWVWFEAPPA